MGYKEMLEKQARTKFIKLSMEQRKELADIYLKSAKEIVKKLENGGYTALTQAYFKSHAKNLKMELQYMMKKGVIKVADIPTEFHTLLWNDVAYNNGLNLSFDRMFGTIPTETLEQLMQGNIYKDGKGLSARIWRAATEHTDNVRNIVYKAQMEGTSALKTAKALEEYLQPGANKPWTRSKIRNILGPGYASMYKQVDYNALRLARTTMTHSYELAQIQAGYKNPYTKGLLWHVSDSHYARQIAPYGEDICDEWDGNVYALDEVPFDHPNGLCYQTTEFLADANAEILANDLKYWANDEYGYGPQLLDGPEVLDDWWKKNGGKYGVSMPKANMTQGPKTSVPKKKPKINPTAADVATVKMPKVKQPPKGFKFDPENTAADTIFKELAETLQTSPGDLKEYELNGLRHFLKNQIKSQHEWIDDAAAANDEIRDYMKLIANKLDDVYAPGAGNTTYDSMEELSKQSLAAAKEAMTKKIPGTKYTKFELDQFVKLDQHDVETFMKSEFDDWYKKMPFGESVAVKEYTGAWYNPMNKILRGMDTSMLESIDIKEAKMYIDDMKAALDKIGLPQDTVLYRGTGKSALGDLANISMDKWAGSIIQDKGFMSTSILEDTAFHSKDLLLEIFAPKGTKGAYVRDLSKFAQENEFILQAGTKMRIIEVVDDGLDTIVKCVVEP